MTFASARRTARATGMGQQPVLLLLLIAGFLAAMGARLAWLQLAHGTENRILADENRVRLVPRSPMRGRLLDRRGRLMAGNRLTYNLYLLSNSGSRTFSRLPTHRGSRSSCRIRSPSTSSQLSAQRRRSRFRLPPPPSLCRWVGSRLMVSSPLSRTRMTW